VLIALHFPALMHLTAASRPQVILGCDGLRIHRFLAASRQRMIARRIG
jgi:hypothetical protein